MPTWTKPQVLVLRFYFSCPWNSSGPVASTTPGVALQMMYKVPLCIPHTSPALEMPQLVIKDRAKCLTGKGVNGINSLLGWWFEFIPFRIGEGARWSLKVLLSFSSLNPRSSDCFPLLLPRAYCSSGLDPFKKKDLSFVRHILLAVFCSVSWWQRINEK